MRRWVTTSVLSVIIILGGLWSFKIYTNYNQSKEFIKFREETLDEVYFPILEESSYIFEKVSSGEMSQYSSWYILEGIDFNNQLIIDLKEARKKIINTELKYLDSILLRQVVLNNIQVHEDLLNDIDTYGVNHYEWYTYLDFLEDFNESMEEVREGMALYSEHLSKYYH